MAGIDIFNNNAFSTFEMMPALERVSTQPDELGRMGLYVPNPVRTEHVAVERRDKGLTIIQTSPRGAPPEQDTDTKRNIRNLSTSRICKAATIKASELQFLREMGEEQAIIAAQAEILRRLSGPMGLIAQIEATWENMRLGALQGVLKDADGTVLYNYATEFSITQPAAVPLALASADAGALRENVEKNILRKLKRAAKGLRYTGVMGLCDEVFWDALMKNPEVYNTYLGQAEASELRNGTLEKEFRFAGVTWKEYMGSDEDGVVRLPNGACTFVPSGPSGMYEVAWSPGETFADIGALGVPMYIMIVPDRDRNMSVELEVYSYPLFLNRRPDCTFTATAA